MNKVMLVGNLTADPKYQTTQSNTSYAQFTVAVNRRYHDANGNQQTDFINCVAWRQTADFVQKYFVKGMRIGVEGSIQTRNYNAQDGSKRYVTEVNVEQVEFVERRQNGAGTPQTAPAAQTFTEVDDDELPF